MHIHSFHRVNARKAPIALARDESPIVAREPLLIDLPLPLPILSVSVAVPILGLTVVVGGEGRLLPTGIIPSLPLPPVIPPTPVPSCAYTRITDT
ncbi:hypothetical protein NLJ89_g4710 [Agrocybe chaxingu]|uniref:Uncharacterized protein n=1 Tax=Agrocybe chaxingu TaxID=84603 RepID=A0A9W8K3J4_9AGAR|nr:hypothetical protein NLJ89_g4710 [Agrocybe chaxingu]